MGDDRYRPRFHLTCPNWMNDPVPFFDAATSTYHVYYQHNPGAPVWGDMHWGHATSRDLLKWEHRPIALAPTPGGPDRDGVWTGCVLRRASDGRHVALYTAIPELRPHFTQLQCAAMSDDLQHWEKLPEPFLSRAPEGNGDCWRDPQHFRGPDGVDYLVIGGERPGRAGGLALLYRATDASLTRWEYSHVLHEGDTDTGHDYECPDFFPLGPAPEDWLLVTSRGMTFWHTGKLTPEMRFERTAFGSCDDGAFYAAKSTEGPGGARLLFGWVTEKRPEAEQVADGWSGALSLPRRVTARPDGRPHFAPAVTLDPADGGPGVERGDAAAGADLPGSFEVWARFASSSYGPRGVLLTWPGGDEHLWLPAPDEAGAEVRVFVDRSVVEAFRSDGTCETRRVYPAEPGRVRVSSYGERGEAPADLHVWEWRG